MQQAKRREPEPDCPFLLVHGVGARAPVDSYGSAPRLAERCKRSAHGFTLEHGGTTFTINTGKYPNVFFHVSVVAYSKQDAEKAIVWNALQKVEWLCTYLDIQTGCVMPHLAMSWPMVPVYMSSQECTRLNDDPWSLPGVLGPADLDRLAGEYPAPVPGELHLPRIHDIRAYVEGRRGKDGHVVFPRTTLLVVAGMLGIKDTDGLIDPAEGLLESDKQAIVDIIKKYDEWSFKQVCADMAAHDGSGGCAEGCNGEIDGGHPECCPAVDFRALWRILQKAFPHEKAKLTFGAYYHGN